MTNGLYARQQLPTPATIAPAQFGATLFDDFVKWIDRGEATTQSYITNLRQFMAWVRYQGIDNPTRQDIISYRDYLQSEHDAIQLDDTAAAGWSYRTDAAGRPLKVNCKPGTVSQYLRSLRQFFKWAAASGLYPDIAANVHGPRIDSTNHKKEALTAADVLQIENSIVDRAEERTQAAQDMQKDTAGRIQRSTEQGKRLFAMYLLAVNAGLRTIELSRANVRDLETKNGNTCLYIWGKGRSEADQKKPLAPEVAAAVRDYLAARTDSPTGASPLFVSTGNRSGGQRIAATTISKMLKQAMQQAGFDSDRLTAHSLRHTAGNNVMSMTRNLFDTQQYMRHSDPATTEIYLHQDTEAADAKIAQQLYSRYHEINPAAGRDRLEEIIYTLDPAQLEALAQIAAAMK